MRSIVILFAWTLPALALAEDAPTVVPPGWERVSLPAKTNAFAIRLGAYGPTEEKGNPGLAVDFDVLAIGLTDRFTVRPLALGAAYRIGSPSSVEALLSTYSNWGFGRSAEWYVSLAPTWDAQAIFGLGRGHRIFTGAAVTTPIYRPLHRDDEGKAFVTGYMGWSLSLGDRWFASLGAAAGREEASIAWLGSQPGEFLEVGAVARHGGALLPTLSYRVSRSVHLDALVTLRRDETGLVQTRVMAGFSRWY